MTQISSPSQTVASDTALNRNRDDRYCIQNAGRFLLVKMVEERAEPHHQCEVAAPSEEVEGQEVKLRFSTHMFTVSFYQSSLSR